MNQPNHPFSPIGAALKKLWRFQVAGFLLLLLFALCGPLTAAAQPTNTLQDQIADVQFEMDKAIAQVQKIVNQPVTAYARQPGMEVPTTEGGWFHPGADKPDFNNVDVRTTQEFPYAKCEYITSDLNPGVMFRGRDLEFNHNTKYFITDRSVPKKKLTEAEMLEINRLYRIIGHCEQQLAQLQPPPTPKPPEETAGEVMLDRYPMLGSTSGRVTLASLLLVGVAFLIGRRILQK